MAERRRTSTDALRAATALMKDNPIEAMALLDDAYQEARREGNARGASMLARHAGVASTMVGDLDGAQRYYEEAVRDEPRDLYLQLAVADICERLGDYKRAAQFFEKAERLAQEVGDVEVASAAAPGVSRATQALSSESVPDSGDS